MRLIDNARLAYDNCRLIKNTWGMNYWQSVINSLLRKYGQ